ncbi:unnamed protein product [Ceutorhynchus assimilis]|uniref:Uncharacterized protein n=1 Tax=Ceutorhynchus assimilis TaxID=467358 RepID=A0A9N9ML98_9CUCU|nr:unnamed protein product [Ceutorhynchus assimilis]
MRGYVQAKFEEKCRRAIEDHKAHKAYVERRTRERRSAFEEARRKADKTCHRKKKRSENEKLHRLDHDSENNDLRAAYKHLRSLREGYKPRTTLYRNDERQVTSDLQQIQDTWKTYFQNLLGSQENDHMEMPDEMQQQGATYINKDQEYYPKSKAWNFNNINGTWVKNLNHNTQHLENRSKLHTSEIDKAMRPKFCLRRDLEEKPVIASYLPYTPQEGYQKADSRNLLHVNVEMVYEFFTNNANLNEPQSSGVKVVRSGREDYGDSAVGYVQVKRNEDMCTVQGRICPEHKVRSKPYTVKCLVDEKDRVVEKVDCMDCAASAGGCKHSVAFLMWLHRRSEEPAPTAVSCY